MKNKKSNLLTISFLVIIITFFCVILLRFFTRQIIVEKMHINNAFTDFVFFDEKTLNEVKIAENDDKNTFNTNWKELYPFENDNSNTNKKENIINVNYNNTIANKLLSSVQSKIQSYSTEHLPLYIDMTGFANKYDNYIKWNMVNYAEYNAILKIDENYLITVDAEKDVSEIVKSVTEFANYCKERNINFIYFEQPSKVSKYTDETVSGVTDFSNQNIDNFIKELKNNKINIYDHREDIYNENLNHHSLFYDTDHHWKAETGLWASKHIIDYLNSNFNYNFDARLLDSNNYEYEEYKDWFLGSQGKKVTLDVVEPDDITIIRPKYKNKIHLVIPSQNIDKEGDFNITYNMKCMEDVDYYNKNPYGAYDYGDCPLIQIENLDTNNNNRILIIHHSFANCEIPFLAMTAKYIDALDLRHFDGSVKEFINQTNPDIVIVTYNSIEEKINYDSHKDIFDFN